MAVIVEILVWRLQIKTDDLQSAVEADIADAHREGGMSIAVCLGGHLCAHRAALG